MFTHHDITPTTQQLGRASAASLWRALVSCCLILLFGCTSPEKHPDAEWFFADLPHPEVIANDEVLPSFRLEEVGRYGTLDGFGALDWVRHVSANDEVLVAHDIRTCEFVVFDRQTRNALRRFGACGEGPDDYQKPNGFILRNDSLVILDAMGTRLTRTSLDGRILSRVRMPHIKSDAAFGIELMGLVGDSVLVAAVGRSGEESGTKELSHEPFVMMYWMHESEPLAGLFTDGPTAASASRDFIKSVDGCVMHRNGTPHLAVMNYWVPQLVEMEIAAEPRLLRNQYLQRVGFRPRSRPGEPGAFFNFGFLGVTCTDDFAIAFWRRTPEPYESGMLTNAGTMILFASESPLPAILEVDSSAAHLLGDPVGAHKSTLFLAHRTRYDVPTIVEVKVMRDTR